MLTEFTEFLAAIENDEQRERLTQTLYWVAETFPQLEARFAWKQPMFTDHGTFIIGFSVAKAHFAIAPEDVTMEKFLPRFDELGYTYGKKMVRIRWDQETDFELLADMIQFNITDKANHQKFWR